MGRLMRLAADRRTGRAAVGAWLLSWPGDLSAAGQSVPLRFGGALHGLILSGTEPALAACYPPHSVGDDRLWGEIETLMTAEALDRWLGSPPQTNEVWRAGADRCRALADGTDRTTADARRARRQRRA